MPSPLRGLRRTRPRAEPTARRIARSYHSPCQQEDLEQVAYLALVKAARRYRHELGRSFPAYAIPTVYGELKRHFRDHGWDVHVPRLLQERALQAQRSAARLAGELGRRPTLGELADRLGCDVAGARDALDAANARDAASLDRPASGDDLAESALERLHGEPDRGFERVEAHALVERLLCTVTPLQREIVGLRYFAELSHREIADRLELSTAQVSRLQRDALDRMRDVARGQPEYSRAREHLAAG